MRAYVLQAVRPWWAMQKNASVRLRRTSRAPAVRGGGERQPQPSAPRPHALVVSSLRPQVEVDEVAAQSASGTRRGPASGAR